MRTMPHLASASVQDFHSSTKRSFIDLSKRYSEDTAFLSNHTLATRDRRRNTTDYSQQSFLGGLPSPPASDSDEADISTVDIEFNHCDSVCRLPQSPVSDSETSRSNDFSPIPRSPTEDPGTCSTINPPPVRKSLQDTKAELDGFPFPVKPVPSQILDPSFKDRHRSYQSPKRRCVSAEVEFLTPPASPDRYVSRRSPTQSPSSTFHISKSPKQLSGTERLLRQKSATPDPFRSPTRLREGRRVAGSDNGQESQSRSRSTSGSNVLGILRSPLTVQNRHASAGAVWNVGGNAATFPTGPIRGISNGRGGLVGSGTNAPMFTSRFLEGETPDQDLERLEGRLAVALELDQTSRMLGIPSSPEQARLYGSDSMAMKRKRNVVDPQTRWKHGAWVQEGKVSRK